MPPCRLHSYTRPGKFGTGSAQLGLGEPPGGAAGCHKPRWHFRTWLGVTQPHWGCLQALSSILLQTQRLTGGIQARGWDMRGPSWPPPDTLWDTGTLLAGCRGCRGGFRGPGAAVWKQHQCHRSSSRSISADPPQTCAQKFSSGYVTRSQRSWKQGQERGLQGPGLLQRGLGARGGCCSQPGTAPGRGTAPGHGTAPGCGTAQRGTAQHIMAQPCHGRSSAAMLNSDTDVAPRGGQV